MQNLKPVMWTASARRQPVSLPFQIVRVTRSPMGLLRVLLAATALATGCSAHRAHSSAISLQTPTVILQQVTFEAAIELPELKNGATAACFVIAIGRRC
jgi:hypothetical protein